MDTLIPKNDMNRLTGKVMNSICDGVFSQVQIKIAGQELSVLLVEGADSVYHKHGLAVELRFKETDVILSTKKDIRMSLSGMLPGKISDLTEEAVLVRYAVEVANTEIIVLMTKSESDQLSLGIGDSAYLYIRPNQIMLSRS